MAVSELLLNYLDELTKDEFDRFKWYLTNPGLDNFKPIPKAHLEDAKQTDTVNKMMQNYMEEGALKVTVTILRKLRRNDLAEKLSQEKAGMQSAASSTSATSSATPAAGPSVVAHEGSVIIAPNLNNSGHGTWNINIRKDD